MALKTESKLDMALDEVISSSGGERGMGMSNLRKRSGNGWGGNRYIRTNTNRSNRLFPYDRPQVA